MKKYTFIEYDFIKKETRIVEIKHDELTLGRNVVALIDGPKPLHEQFKCDWCDTIRRRIQSRTKYMTVR
jgi:hypothetical protein